MLNLNRFKKEAHVIEIVAYLLYLALSLAVTVWVARTLHRNGRLFLVDSFLGNEALADSVNHLLVVGFYLINVGYIALTLRYGTKPHDAAQTIEYLSSKVGVVLLILGVMHFLNIRAFSQMRRRAVEGARRPAVPRPNVMPPAGV
jgi:hypothetical protein